MYSFEIVPQSWFKRRLPTREDTVGTVVVENFAKVENLYCNVVITMQSGTVYYTEGRVYKLLEKWRLQALTTTGISVILQLNEAHST